MEEAVAKVLERIRMYRLKGLSILELANRANVSHSYVFYLESKRKVPSLTTLNKLATAMDLSMRDFFEPKEEARKRKPDLNISGRVSEFGFPKRFFKAIAYYRRGQDQFWLLQTFLNNQWRCK